jgi:ubiquinol-cytochrome c reductase iron-sulfur subunit
VIDDYADQHIDHGRRRLLTISTTGMGLAGAAALMAPFAGSLTPSEKAKAAGAPVKVDISKLDEGQQITVEWRGKPVWVIRRSGEALDFLPSMDSVLVDPNSNSSIQPEYADNAHRSIKPEYLVLVGICTHLGCSPKYRPELTASNDGAFLCACHGSRFDLAGRVFKNVPAPKNLPVPPHKYLSDGEILIGTDREAA